MSDATSINSSNTVRVTGVSSSTGLPDNYLDIDSTGRVTSKLNDGTGNAINSINNQLQVRDVLNTSSQYRAQSVTTSATEALGGSTILVNRKLLTITPTNGTIYWGYSNSVTTSTGTPLFPNNTLFLSITDNIHVYLIAGSTTDVRIGELS